MRDMFYNYDNNIPNNSCNNYPDIYKYKKAPKTFNTFHGAKMLRDKAGKFLGIEATRNSTVRLFFSFEGLSDPEEVQNLLENNLVRFDVLDTNHNILLECDVEVFSLYDMVSIELILSEESKLVGGNVYKMHLYTIIDGVTYDLFSENDGLLYVK